jgi:pyruvate,water dikinase
VNAGPAQADPVSPGEAAFEPPGAGLWELDRSHYTGGATPIIQWLMADSCEAAYKKLFAEFGVPAETLSVGFVNGFMYTRLRPLVGADKPPRRSPPTIVLKAVARLHPEFRRRTQAAARTLEERPWRNVVRDWQARIRPELEAANLELQAVDVGQLGDAELADHLDALVGHLRATYEEHFRLHGYDLGPIGMLIRAGRGWGLTATDIVPALVGASPSTSAPAEALAALRAGLEASGVRPTTLDDVRAVSPEMAAELDRYLRHRHAMLYSGYDLDTPTLGEAPEVVLTTITSGRSPAADRDAAARLAAELRARVPESDRNRFDDLLNDARAAMDMRDDNGPVTVEWPSGLLRLGMLEAGRRLAARGRIADPDHVFELTHLELSPLARTDEGPSAEALTERAERRRRQKALDPPETLGTPEPRPPLDALPTPLVTMIETIEAILAELGMAERTTRKATTAGPRLTGTGIGSHPVVAVARTADSAEEAIARLSPGEILVTRTTSPAYNLVLTLVGGLVTAEGGPMSHAAVLSRELDIPAVVGAPDALSAIADGDTIEVDPTTGTVSVVSPAGQVEAAAPS